jgi:hypothetical protein
MDAGCQLGLQDHAAFGGHLTMTPALRSILFGASSYFLDGRLDVAAAFSLRRVRGTYTGPLVRLRRASDSAELDFGAGQKRVSFIDVGAWAGGDAFATTFYDQSGNARDLVQATAANQPQVILAANSRPALLFDGSNDTMASGAFTLNQPHSRNAVYRLVTAASGEKHIIDGKTGNTSILFFEVASGRTFIYAGSSVGTNTTAMPVGQRGAVGVTYNGASSRIEFNGFNIASETGNPGAGNPGGLTIGSNGGGGSPANVEIQEVVQFDTAHTQSQLQADNAAMRAAWGF